MKLLIDKRLTKGKINRLMKIDKDKIQSVYKYLQDEFPKCQIKDWFGCDKNKITSKELAQTFKIFCKEFTYFVTIEVQVFEDNTPIEIYSWLESTNLPTTIPKKNVSRVTVDKNGTVKER